MRVGLGVRVGLGLDPVGFIRLPTLLLLLRLMRLPWDLGTPPQVVLVVEVVVGVELVGGALVEEDEEPYVVVAERSFPIPKGARFYRCCT